jgi:CheY-like chemotaxis protein
MPGARILVVDDDPQIRRVLRTSLTSHGYILTDARSGEEALLKIREERFDLILLDVNMPGMGGMAAAAQLRARHPAIPICIISANVQCATRDKALALGVGFAEKPITLERIAQIIAVVEDV